jgi:hypothetical protein
MKVENKMGKRSDFERISKDVYLTIDPRSTLPLVEYLGYRAYFYEPCYGKGNLVDLLQEFSCVGYSDTEKDARTTRYSTHPAEFFITNPPWTRKILHPIIDNLRKQLPTWLLFDADWMHTQQAIPYMEYCKTIISVGRLKWIPDSTMDGKDNCVWYLFTDEKTDCTFIPRKSRK